MHSFPEWFIVVMYFITNPILGIGVLVSVAILSFLIIRKIARYFRKKKDNVITEIPTVDMTK